MSARGQLEGTCTIRGLYIIDDVRFAVETARFDLATTLAVAHERRASLRDLAARYLWAKHRDEARVDISVFAQLLSPLETAGYPDAFRDELLGGVEELVDRSDAHRSRSVQALFRLFVLDPRREQLIELSIPRLIGLDRARATLSPTQVFGSTPVPETRRRRQFPSSRPRARFSGGYGSDRYCRNS